MCSLIIIRVMEMTFVSFYGCVECGSRYPAPAAFERVRAAVNSLIDTYVIVIIRMGCLARRTFAVCGIGCYFWELYLDIYIVISFIPFPSSSPIYIFSLSLIDRESRALFSWSEFASVIFLA
jgi:hypothetical protein